MEKGHKILCIGDLILDRYVHGEIDRISPEAPIPILRIGEKKYNVLGGCGNVAKNICASGSRCHLIALVGKDGESSVVRKLITTINNLTCDLIMDEDRCTTKKVRYVSDNQQVLRVDHEETKPISKLIEAKIIKIIKKKIEDCKIVILSDYNKGIFTPNLVKTIINIAKRKNKIIIVDPKRHDFSIYKGATYITPNFSELKQATNFPDQKVKNNNNLVIKLSKVMIKKLKFKAIITTRSKDGISVVDSSNNYFHLPSEAKEVFDVSGAGDTVLAYLASSILRGDELRTATMISNIAAGIAVGKFGTSVVSQEEINNVEKRKTSFSQNSTKEKKKNKRQRKVGFTNGCFDLIHAGHVSYLKKAKEMCDFLILALNSDKSIKKLKGDKRPIMNEKDRIEILSSLKFIDEIIVFDELTPIKLIKKIKPDFIFKGKDYKKTNVVGFKELKRWGGKVVLIDFLKNKSTTNIIKRINNAS